MDGDKEKADSGVAGRKSIYDGEIFLILRISGVTD